jgi:hypothetical protein
VEKDAVRITSHVSNEHGQCQRCGLDLKEIEISGPRFTLKKGVRVGIIDGLKHANRSAYVIHHPEHDSNKMCRIVP